MHKKSRVKRFPILILIVALGIFLYSCTQVTDTPSSNGDNDEIYKGPGRGEGINTGDFTFRSLTVSRISPEVVYIGTEGNGVFKSTDGGANWTWLRHGILYTDLGYPEVYDMAIHPTDNNTVYAALLDG